MSTHKHFAPLCNICNKSFVNQKELDEHYLSHEDVINTYDCNICSRKFLQKYQLGQHIEFHVTASSNEFTAKEKETVHFNTIVESKGIVDHFSSDADDDSDYEKGSSRVDKQFLYVGPKQDINKIKTIMEEVKTISSPDVTSFCDKLPIKTINPGLFQNSCNKSAQNMENLNATNSYSANSSNKSISTEDKLNQDDLNGLETEDGIDGEKKVVKDFTVIKVTPELMEEIQRKKLEEQNVQFENIESFGPEKSNTVSSDVSPVTSGVAKDLNKASPVIKITNTNQGMEKENCCAGQIFSEASPKISDSNATDQVVKNHVEASQNIQNIDENKVIPVNTLSKCEKTPEQKTELSNLHKEKSKLTISNIPELISATGNREKLLQRLKAKIDEKEHKKKEKYEFKKKMRYMEKLKKRKNPDS